MPGQVVQETEKNETLVGKITLFAELKIIFMF